MVWSWEVKVWTSDWRRCLVLLREGSRKLKWVMCESMAVVKASARLRLRLIRSALCSSTSARAAI